MANLAYTTHHVISSVLRTAYHDVRYNFHNPLNRVGGRASSAEGINLRYMNPPHALFF